MGRVDDRPNHLLLFVDVADFENYLMNPADFNYDEHLIRLHPGAVAAAG